MIDNNNSYEIKPGISGKNGVQLTNPV